MPNFAGGDLALCLTCGTQYDTPLSKPPSSCMICEDPRQYVPPAGQQWTSLHKEQGKHKNEWKQDENDSRIWYLYTDPKLGIGERGILIQTEHGNVLWDLFAYIGEEIFDFINSKGGLKAIVISHPHFYTTHLVWSTIFDCPVYTHTADSSWLQPITSASPLAPYTHNRKLITTRTQEILPGVTAIKIGGHFPGQLALHYDSHLFHADGFIQIPAAGTPAESRARVKAQRGQPMSTYSFMWAIPNMIPLNPDEIGEIWRALKGFEWEATHGLMMGMEVRGSRGEMKGRLLESMQVQVRRMGWREHWLLGERVDETAK